MAVVVREDGRKRAQERRRNAAAAPRLCKSDFERGTIFCMETLEQQSCARNVKPQINRNLGHQMGYSRGETDPG
ncbi:unnamed protein product [Rangifer tarandus platyrhynchus]|uniref:Uncharacterized protein n=1 Tax=Rangifer tarandus platyrhynchus TaxID=3082113 RepID=A0AC59YN79_RANTA